MAGIDSASLPTCMARRSSEELHLAAWAKPALVKVKVKAGSHSAEITDAANIKERGRKRIHRRCECFQAQSQRAGLQICGRECGLTRVLSGTCSSKPDAAYFLGGRMLRRTIFFQLRSGPASFAVILCSSQAYAAVQAKSETILLRLGYSGLIVCICVGYSLTHNRVLLPTWISGRVKPASWQRFVLI